MNSDPSLSSETDDGTRTARTLRAEASDNTLRLNVQVPAIVSTEATPTPAHFDHFGGNSEEGYFALNPKPKPSQSQTSAETSDIQALSSSRITSSSSASLKLRDTVLEATRIKAGQLDTSARPNPQRDLSHLSDVSLASTDSNATVTTAYPGYAAASSFRASRFPNQSYAALQDQQYPRPHLPPPLRTKSLLPGDDVDFSAAIASLHASGSRTADDSPAVTPGLFNPAAKRDDRERDSGLDQGYYPSPYLHWSHRQAPKETHVADVDVDPISGRKIINEYEIIDELGRGTHGKVKLGRNVQTGEYVAIKIVERYSKKRRLGKLGNAEDKVKREVAILKKARHPNIVALLEVIDDPARKKVYIVLERVDLGEIAWRVQSPKEIPLVECRRYERESRGIFDDAEAEAEDQAVMDLARTRRAKESNRRWRRLRRGRRTHEQPSQDVSWSIEFGGDTEDDESDLERASRVSTSNSTSDMSADPTAHLERIISRAATPGLPDLAENPDPAAERTSFTDGIPAPIHDTGEEANDPGDVLHGTMYGSYAYESRHSGAANLLDKSRAHDVRDFGRHPRSDNLMERATELLDSDMHPDLLFVPCMTMQAARVAFRDTLLGLQYLHYQGIIHRDIKPPNLLQTRDHRTKISDFGVSYLGRPFADDQAENLSESDAQDFDEAKELARTVGTAAFYAPELCYTDIVPDEPPPVGKAIDVWALGITLFCMLFGRVPFIDSEYVVMRRIADDDIYVPNRRLKPADIRPDHPSSSHGRHHPSASSGSRLQVELAYEDLDDTLLDLLHRLLTKDPRERITLEEVRHHPWVVADIGDKGMWLDETDPSRQAQGKKIEVSNQELNEAVVPIQLIDRIRSGIKKLGGTLGLGKTSSSTRKRATSGAASTISANSSSSTIAQDAQKHSLRGDESIFSALKASREEHHPLAHSESASPTQPVQEQPFLRNDPSLAKSYGLTRPKGDQGRPSLPDRARSAMSNTGSVRTVKAVDPAFQPVAESSPPSSPVLSHAAFESAGGVGGLLHGAGRLLSGARARSTASSSRRHRSSSRNSRHAADAHSNATVGVSTASALGHMDPPQALKNISAGSGTYTSPTASRQQSVATTPNPIQSHAVPMAQTRSRRNSQTSPKLYNPQATIESRPRSRATQESSEVSYQRADDHLMIHQVHENRDISTARHPDHLARPLEMRTRPSSSDDEMYRQKMSHAVPQDLDSIAPSLDTSPTSHESTQPLITPSTSEEHFALGTRSFTSNPNFANGISKDSSLSDVEESGRESLEDLMSSGDTIEMAPAPRELEEDEGYQPDHVIDTDEDDESYSSSEDDDGGLVMMHRKSSHHGSNLSTSLNNSLNSKHRERRGTGLSARFKKSERSGSSNTMKKVRSNEDSEPERRQKNVLAAPPA